MKRIRATSRKLRLVFASRVLKEPDHPESLPEFFLAIRHLRMTTVLTIQTTTVALSDVAAPPLKKVCLFFPHEATYERPGRSRLGDEAGTI